MYDYNVWRARPGRGVAVTDKANHWYEVYCGVRVLAVKTNQVGQKENLGLNSRAAPICAATSAKVDTKACHELAACSS